jgi:hypothetical protein
MKREKGYEKSTDKYVLLADVFQEYRDFCAEDGYRPAGKKVFGNRLRQAKFLMERKRDGMVVFTEKNFLFDYSLFHFFTGFVSVNGESCEKVKM